VFILLSLFYSSPNSISHRSIVKYVRPLIVLGAMQIYFDQLIDSVIVILVQKLVS